MVEEEWEWERKWMGIGIRRLDWKRREEKRRNDMSCVKDWLGLRAQEEYFFICLSVQLGFGKERRLLTC